jgi:hypothetical protein
MPRDKPPLEIPRVFPSCINSSRVFAWGYAVAQWLRHYAISRKVAVRDSTRRINVFLNYVILPAALGPGIYLACKRNEYQMQKNNAFWSRARPVYRDDSLAICEPTI